MWHFNTLYELVEHTLDESTWAARRDRHSALASSTSSSSLYTESETIKASYLNWSAEMAGHQEPVMMQKRGSSGLSATLAAAGLADPDILALAQEADTLVYHSRVAQDGTPLHSTHEPAAAAAARKTVGPPAAHSTSPRPHRSHQNPAAKPVVLPTAGTGYAGRTSPIPVKGPSPIYGSKRTVSNSYALSRSNSNAGAKIGSAAPSRTGSGAGLKSIEPHHTRNDPGSINSSSSAGYKPNVPATVSAYNAAARTGSSALPRSRNNSNAGYAHSGTPSRSNSSAGAAAARKPGNTSSFSTRTAGHISSSKSHTHSSSSSSPSHHRSAVSAFAAASRAAADSASSSSKVILHSTFSIGHDDSSSMARSSSMGPSSGGAAAPTAAGSIGAFPNTLHRRTASLPCWPNDSTAVSTAASAMEVELEEAFVAAVASGEHFSSTSDDGLEITLASPPAATSNTAGNGTSSNSASVPSMTTTLERAQMAGAREVEYAAAAAHRESAYYAEASAAAAAAAVSRKGGDEGEMAGSRSATIALGGSGYAAAAAGGYYSNAASNSNDASRGNGYSSSSGSSGSAAATPKAGGIASSTFVANPRQVAPQPASLLNTDEFSTADGSNAAAAAARGSGMTYKPDAQQQTISDMPAPGNAIGGSYAEGLRQRSGSGLAPAAAAASLSAAAEDECQQQQQQPSSSVFDVSYQLGGKLPVLTEELHEKGSAASSATNTGASNTGGGAAAGNWWNLSSRRVHPQQSNNTSRGGAEEPAGSLGGGPKENDNKDLSRNSMQSEKSTARPSSAGVKGDKRISEVSVYTDQSLVPEAAKGSSSKRKRWMCLLLPLLLLLSATGVFVGLYVTKQLRPGGGAAAGGPLTFQVTVAAPARTASESCDIWFGSSERIGLYKRLFASAYSNALDLPITDTTVNSVACGGNSVFSSTGVRSLRSSRTLLQAAATAAGSGGSALTWVDITTVFSVSAPADARVQKTVTDTVTSSSSGILAGPLSQFLGVNTLLVKASGAVKDAPSATAALPKAAGSDWPQVPVLAVDESPEAGALSADSAGTAAQTAQPSLTGSNQRRSGTEEEPKQPVEVITPHAEQPNKQQQQQQQQQPKKKKQASSTPVATAAAASSASSEPTELQLSNFAWNLMAADAAATAPACQFSPSRSNSVSDSQGQFWSLMNGKECTFKAASAAARKAAEAAGAELTWEGAPLCTAAPTKATAVADAAGNLWGFEGGSSCTYKDENGASQKLKNKNKPASLPMLWEQAPVCDFAPSKDNSTADVLGRLWGVDAQGRGCTFRFVEA
uniref:Uncharacterized protein n=1 Tax=Tetradesmus obliquus TaxID=3088 RepID=A0A383WJ56_TETOB|eukprot:jgi/Sobl393_1/11442/SZX63013.1